MGTVMAVFGRSLEVARLTSVIVASAAATLPYLALRSRGIDRSTARLAAIFAFGAPWAIWLGAATVPESFTASLATAGVVGLCLPSDRRTLGDAAFAACLVAACLSRYEPWPMAAVACVHLAREAWRQKRSTSLLLALACVAGPLAWMAWNAHAHDGPLHFLHRVASYKRAIGQGSEDALTAALAIPIRFFWTRPEVAVPSLALLPFVLRDPTRRTRWATVLVAVLAELAFLAYGNARDGAPTHHAERALLAALWLSAVFVAVELRVPYRAAKVLAVAVSAALAMTLARPETPGRSPEASRAEAVARGRSLSAAKHLVVRPCAYEHFALIAAYGAPERASVVPSADDPPCPHVDAL
jgi:hypothetical protein